MSNVVNKPVQTHFLDFIVENNVRITRQRVKRVLIIYEDVEFFLGDNCIILYKLSLCKHFFGPDVLLDINFVTEQFKVRYEDVCKNNPNWNELLFQGLEEVAYEQYDVVITISLDEEPLLDLLMQAYNDLEIRKPAFALFSFGRAVFFQKKRFKQPVFPFYEELFRYADNLGDQPYELFISPEEKEWGNRWLEEKGLRRDEQLFVLVDNASDRNKLLTLETYYGVLLHLLHKDNARILIFDEKNWGKELFYKEWLDEKDFNKIIFSKGLKLREDLCILGSDNVRLVFGPCTGLLHCASGIYNNYVTNGLDVSAVPLIVTYTGKWDAEFWWDASPLVNCLLLREPFGQISLTELKELSAEEKKYWDDRLSCSEYTAEMLTGFIDKRFSEQRSLHLQGNA